MPESHRSTVGSKVAFLIFACPKSGTTWVQRMLSAHPDIHCSESRAFGGFYNPTNPSAPHLALDRFFVDFFSRYHSAPIERDGEKDGRFENFYHNLTHRVLDTIATVTLENTVPSRNSRARKSVYGEKATPPAFGTSAAILAGYRRYRADLPLIHLIRDGRDVAISGFVQRANNVLNFGTPTPEEAGALRACLLEQRLPDDALHAWADEWADAVSVGREAAKAWPKAIEIRYELMLEDASSALRDMLQLIEEGLDPAERSDKARDKRSLAEESDIIDACLEAASFRTLSGGRAEGEEDRGSFFRKGVAGDWRRWLTPAQIDWYAASPAGALLKELGYPAS
ncbi:MAG: sulfotransferase domain-containing protein [Planctomycetota bacterium]